MRAALPASLVMALGISVAPSAQAIPAPTPGEAALGEVAGPFLALDTWSARFTQTQFWVGIEEPVVARGRLFLMRPGLFRIEYDEPQGHIQVSDGTQVWTYVPENQEALRATLPRDSRAGGDPLRMVLERSEPDSLVGEERLGGTRARVLSLTPEPELGLTRVRIWIDPRDASILQYEITENSGNRSVYALSHVARNPRLERELFTFTPPPGVPVVEVGAP